MAQPDIADLIEQSATELVRLWVEAVRADTGITSDGDLTEGGLVDHIPGVIDEICAVLRTGAQPRADNTRESRVHAYTRYRQGYRARDLIRESSHLRLILLDHVSRRLRFQTADARFGAFHDAARTINLYIDEEMRYAVSIYTEELKLV
ncbi:MAG: RsbRD N-terminal domain-containing protein [Pyrinomonadaceae bacterium]